MSKHMQLTVAVRPYYLNGMDKTYPRLARHLGYLAPELAAKNPSLYELTGELDRLLFMFEGTKLREVLLRHRETLKQAHEKIQDNISNWNLSAADRGLYQLEDIFDEVEAELS